MSEQADAETRLVNAEATIVALLRNISALEKVVDVLLDHWGDDKEKARRGLQFICDHEVKKHENNAERQAAWKDWARSQMATDRKVVEGPRF